MTLADWAQLSNYAVASATVIIGLAFLAHLAEWAMASRGALVPAGSVVAPDETPDRSTVLSSIGVSLTTLAAAILTIGSVGRGIAAERVPWGNMYEFTTSGTVIALVTYLVLVRVWSIEWLGALVTGFSLVLLGVGFSVYVPAGPLVPSLQSYWLVIHVAAVMIAGALFMLAAAASALYLVKARAESLGRTGPLLARLPLANVMDRLAFRVTAVGFVLWTFGALIAGPIWAHNAWGRYWGWDPKEVWAFVTWVVYASYLHARVTRGWKGKRAAIVCLIGFATFLFSFYGVNLIFGGSQHTYSK